MISCLQNWVVAVWFDDGRCRCWGWLLIHWTGVIATGLGGGLSGIWVAGTMVTLGDNTGGVSVGILRDGAGQYVWSAPAVAGCGVFGACAVGGFSVTLEKMRESVWMAAS